MRLGFISCASIDGDRSRTIIKAEVFFATGSGSFSQAGPASAVHASTQAVSHNKNCILFLNSEATSPLSIK